MPVLELTTEIDAPIQRVFDLARSIDLHKISTKHTHEEAIAGVTSGLIGLGESVTWRAKHFGIYQTLTSKITEMKTPFYFVDEMQKGIFHSFKHEHLFQEKGGVVHMTDVFDYTSPLSFLGNLADWLFLKKYMSGLLYQRNQIVKAYAESQDWQAMLRGSV